MNFYQRNLPHWHPEDAEFFITFRLANTLPNSVVKRMNQNRDSVENQNEKVSDVQRKIFQKYEKMLDNADFGPVWLSNPEIANLVFESIKYRDKKVYDLYCFCIMPNHVHLILKMYEQSQYDKATLNQLTLLTKVLKELKRYTAKEANKILGRNGQFWQHESYDRVIRNSKELERTIHYTLNNPVKAGLTKDWKEWPFSYFKSDFEKIFKIE